MTIIIISALLILFSLGLVIPQKMLYASRAQYDEWKADYPVISRLIELLRFNDIYVAPITVFFLGLFFVNLIVVLGYRIPVVLKRSYLYDRTSSLSGLDAVKADVNARQIVLTCQTADTMEILAKEAASFFRKRFWSVISPLGSYSFVAVRNRLSPLGFLFFHASFLLCLIGGLLIMYTRFSGNLVLTEGEEFYSDIKQFRKITREPRLFHALPELGLTLLTVTPHFSEKVATDLDISVKVKYFSEVIDAVVRVNQPFKKGAVSILPGDIGVSPLFILRNRGGEVAQGGYFSLNVLKGAEDSFEFPDMPYKIYVSFYPDFTERDGRKMTRSFQLVNPVFRFRIEKEGKVLFDGYRKPGEGVAIDSYELICPGIRYWVDFLIVREYGNDILFAGFFLGVIGLIMRLVFFQKTVKVCLEKRGDTCVVFLGGRSEYFQQTFLYEEMEQLTADLKKQLNLAGHRLTGGVSA